MIIFSTYGTIIFLGLLESKVNYNYYTTCTMRLVSLLMLKGISGPCCKTAEGKDYINKSEITLKIQFISHFTTHHSSVLNIHNPQNVEPVTSLSMRKCGILIIMLRNKHCPFRLFSTSELTQGQREFYSKLWLSN